MKKLKKISEYWKYITSIVAILVAMWGVFAYLSGLKEGNDKILEELKTTKQMALKSVIWNDEIPLTERANACDLYLSAGYNSLTKEKCQKILKKDIIKGILF